MPKKRVLQGGGTKEAQPILVGSGSVVKLSQEQPHIGQSEPEPTDYRELIETFDKTLQRWKANICIPEYCLDIPGLSTGQDEGEERSDWSYCITYPPTTPPRIIPQGFYEAGTEDVTVMVSSITSGLRDELIFLAFNFNNKNEAFEDPHTNEDLSGLTVILERHNLVAAVGKPSFSLIIAESTKDDKERALEYHVGYPTGKLRIETRKVDYSDEFVSKEAEVLSEPHALALFNLMDRLIPPGTNTPTQQPERRTTPELQAPRPLRIRTPRG